MSLMIFNLSIVSTQDRTMWLDNVAELLVPITVNTWVMFNVFKKNTAQVTLTTPANTVRYKLTLY